MLMRFIYALLLYPLGLTGADGVASRTRTSLSRGPRRP